jgi:hypothetical protein
MTFQDDSKRTDENLISVRDAYLAMFYFIDAYWQRGGRADGSITLLRHALGPTTDPDSESSLLTADPASWSDWLSAVDLARSQGVPTAL